MRKDARALTAAMTEEWKISAAQAAEKLKKYSSWMIVCHENPDGDALGCAFALCSLGMRTGRRVSVVCRSRMPERYSFLPHSDVFMRSDAPSVETVAGALLVAVDISNESRALSNMKELLEACAGSINIDHHGDNTLFAEMNFVAPEASATAELITAVFEAFGEGIDEGEAAALYTALVSDNGNFRYNSTTPESHRCAQVLLRAGADPAEIDDTINENLNEGALRLWGLALTRAEVFAGGACALFWLRADEIRAAGGDAGVLDGLINMLMRLKGVKAALFLTERYDGGCKLSVRSRAPFNARVIAGRFGGGGHISAAGAKIAAGFDETLAAVRKEAEAYAAIRNTAS